MPYYYLPYFILVVLKEQGAQLQGGKLGRIKNIIMQKTQKFLNWLEEEKVKADEMEEKADTIESQSYYNGVSTSMICAMVKFKQIFGLAEIE